MRWIGTFLVALACAGALLAAAPEGARAGVLLEDRFDYPDGSITATANGWGLHSGAIPPIVSAKAVTVSSTRTGDVHKALQSTVTSGQLYASMELTSLVTPTALQGAYFAHFVKGSSNFTSRFYVRESSFPGTFNVGVANTAGSGSAAFFLNDDLPSFKPAIVVVRFDFAATPTVTSTIWVNPESEADPGRISSSDTPSFSLATGLDGFALRQDSAMGTLRIDNLRIGTAFEDIIALNLTSRTSSPATLTAGATNVLVGAFDSIASGGAITLASVSVTASGPSAQADFDAVKLYRDANGNGALDVGTDVLMGSAAFTGPNALITPSSGGLTAGSSTALLLAVDVDAAASGGNAYTFTITTATATRAGGAAHVDGLPLSTPQGTVQGGGGAQLVCSAANPPSRSVAPGAADEAVLGLHLVAVGQDTTVTAIALQASGSGHDVTHIAASGVKVYHDANANHLVDGGEMLLASGVFNGDDGTANLAFSQGLAVLTGGGTKDIVVAYTFQGAGIPAGATFTARATGLTVSVGSATQLPIDGATVTVNPAAGPQLTFSAQNPTSRTVSAGTADAAILGVEVAAVSTAQATLSSVRVQASGTGDDRAAVVTGVKLFRDANANGVVDAGEQMLAGPSTYAADDGTVDLALSAPLVVSQATPVRLLVAYSFASSVTAGSTFVATVTSASASAAGGVSVSGLPIAGATLTLPQASVLFTPGAVAGAAVAAGTANRLVLAVTLAASANTASVSTVRVDALGTGDDASEVTAVRLFEDTNGNGTLEVGTDAALNGAGQTFSSNNGFVNLTAGGLAIGPGASKRLLVAYSLAAGAVGGGTFTPRLSSAVLANGAASGLPLDGATLTVQAGTASFNPTLLPGRQVDRGAQNEVIASFEVVASGGALVLNGFDAKAGGSMDDPVEVSATSLFRDANANGQLDVGTDTLLDRRTFASNDGTVSFSCSALTGTPLSLGAGQGARLFVAVSFVAAAVPTHDIRLTLQSAVVTGGVASGLPIATSALEIKPGEVLFTAAPVASRTASPGAAGVLIANVNLTTAGGPQSVTSLAVTASGTGDDSTRIAAVKLYRDNFDGAFNAANDTLLETRTFAADNGTVVFTFGGAPLAVASGAGTRLFLAYDLAAAGPGSTQTLRARIDSAAVVNGVALGLPVDSATLSLLPASFGTLGGSGGGGGGGCVAATAGVSDPAAALPWAALLLAMLLARVRRRHV
jgi:hypothetical protein